MLIPDPVAAYNERLKLLSSSINALGIGMVAVAAVKPMIETGVSISAVWSVVGLALHAIAHYVIGRMKKAG